MTDRLLWYCLGRVGAWMAEFRRFVQVRLTIEREALPGFVRDVLVWGVPATDHTKKLDWVPAKAPPCQPQTSHNRCAPFLASFSSSHQHHQLGSTPLTQKEGHRQHIKSEGLRAGPKNWVPQETLSIDGLDFLSDGNRTAEEIGTGLARASKQVSLSGRRQSRPMRTWGSIASRRERTLFSDNQTPQVLLYGRLVVDIDDSWPIRMTTETTRPAMIQRLDQLTTRSTLHSGNGNGKEWPGRECGTEGCSVCRVTI